VVRPGADLRRILVGFSGAEKLEVDARGDLLLRTGPDVIRQRKPIAYQEVNGMRREIPVSYVLKGAHRVAFKVAAHDSRWPLISGNSAIVAGTCTNSGAPCTFVADLTDSGPTGSGDTFTISISGGPARGGPLRSGKIQVRPR